MHTNTDIENQGRYTELKSVPSGSLISEQRFCDRNEYHIKFCIMVAFALALILGGSAFAGWIDQSSQD